MFRSRAQMAAPVVAHWRRAGVLIFWTAWRACGLTS